MKHHITNKKRKIKGKLSRKTKGKLSRKTTKIIKTRKKPPILKDNFYHYVNNSWFFTTQIYDP